MPVLIDIEAASPACCDEALETLAKAGGETSHLWDRAPNPYIAGHIEAVTQRLSGILQQMQDVLTRFLNGHPEELRKADTPWLRMSPAHFEIVRVRLESMNPARFTVDDWMLLVEWIIARYLPDGVIDTEAQYIAVRSALLAKIQANLERDPRIGAERIDKLTALLPTDFAHVPPRVLTPLENAIMVYGKAHAAEAIRNVSEGGASQESRIE